MAQIQVCDIMYECICGKLMQGEYPIEKRSYFSFARCHMCLYPLVEKQYLLSMSDFHGCMACPMCSCNDPENMHDVLSINEVNTIQCDNCHGLVPFDELISYWEKITTMISMEESGDGSTASVDPTSIQLTFTPDHEQLETCFRQHNVSCSMNGGSYLLLNCNDCKTTIGLKPPIDGSNDDPVLKHLTVSDEVLRRALDRLDLCGCYPVGRINFYRLIVIEDDSCLIIKCPRCQKQSKTPGWMVIRRLFSKDSWGDVDSEISVNLIEDLQIGDHLVYKRALYTHHSVVTAVDTLMGTYCQIHYTESEAARRTGGSALLIHKGVIKEEEAYLDLSKPETVPTILVYPPLDCFPIPTVISRAKSRINEEKYNVVTSNCEHFVRWCKIGESSSKQVQTVVKSGFQLLNGLKTLHSSVGLLTGSATKAKILQSVFGAGIFFIDAMLRWKKG